MKILLLGKDGQVGFELRRALATLGQVHAVGRQDCDLADEPALSALLSQARPDVIVNAAAYTAVDQAESEQALAFAINAHAPAIIGRHAAASGALVIHYSTDYVFAGDKPGTYTEQDATGPQSVYGASKLIGEEALQASGARHLIFRTSWVYGAHGANFAKTMLRLAAERESLNIVADQWGAPTSAALIADITAHMIREATGPWRGAFPYGIYHLVAGGETHWHEYACHVIARARAAGWPIKVAQEAIKPIATAHYPTPARRPANSRLSTLKLRQTFGLALPDWRENLDHVLDQILKAN